MAAHFSVQPAVSGTITWKSPSTLVFSHPPLSPLTTYTVRLSSGYRDLLGHPNQLAHGWKFTTEAPPSVTGSSPAPREQNIDPSSYIALQFSREMDLGSLQGAISISPYVPITVHRDPGDARRAIVAPQTLLDPGTTYSLSVTPGARDVDGNPLLSGLSIDFGTGSTRPLRHWVTFVAGEGRNSSGIWAVDESRIPRQVTPFAADTFTWSTDGTRLLAHSPTGAWADVALDGEQKILPVHADWAGYLAHGLGYAFVDNGKLSILSASGKTTAIDSDVTDVTVSPDGERLAYVSGGTQVRGYTIDLQSHYRIGAETGTVDGLAWAPDGSRLAYRVATIDLLQSHIRVKNLLGSGNVLTVATGEVDTPSWQADSRHVLLSATVQVNGTPRSRAFRISVTDPATAPLSADVAIPGPADANIHDPVPSPDGHQLAFLQVTAGGQQTWVMNVDGTGLGPLTAYDAATFPYSCRAPAWTPT